MLASEPSNSSPPDPESNGWRPTFGRRLRELFVMGVVGPVMGVLAITAVHVVTRMQESDAMRTAAAARESDRALALLEDRPPAAGSLASPRGVSRSAAIDTKSLESQPSKILQTVLRRDDATPELREAVFGSVKPTPSARRMADWVVGRGDNGELPFVVLDKRAARLYVFEPAGRLVDETPVLLGSSHGDDTYPGIGDVPIAQVKPYQRTTAAGRFVTQPGLDADKTDVVWLDYDAALAMHRVINKVKSERRLQRLASTNPAVRRISWGCINIPIEFFDRHISPVFGKRTGVVYVIPERKTFAEVFEHEGGGAPVVATATPTAASNTLAPKDIGNR